MVFMRSFGTASWQKRGIQPRPADEGLGGLDQNALRNPVEYRESLLGLAGRLHEKRVHLTRSDVTCAQCSSQRASVHICPVRRVHRYQQR